VDAAIKNCDVFQSGIVVQHTGNNVACTERDIWYHELLAGLPSDCPCEPFDAETPLFILYTSGSTGKPKGVLHTSGGYLLYAAMTHKYAFDYQQGDVYWCTADIGWVTGHSYIVYGPLANGATTLMFEGIPTYPDASRFWQVIDKHQVNIFYTAPTAIRALMGAGDEFVKTTKRDSLRVLATVGEPINPEAWEWYYHTIGKANCPVVDTWWQTETGGHIILPLPYATKLKPGSASKPFFGIEPQVVNEQGEVLTGEAEGILVLARSWPGQMRTLYNNHSRFIEAYFSTFAGKYFSGDGVKRDKDGYYWITGRVDDVLNVSGHRLGTAEIESALVLHKSISEAAVVGYAHDIKGQGIYAYVSVMNNICPTDALKAELVKLVRREIGPIATVDKIQFADKLPKTRSGKIMRRILRKIAQNDYQDLGDTSTLAEPEVVQDLINNRV
jgi:acetyl-CoA synthetase